MSMAATPRIEDRWTVLVLAIFARTAGAVQFQSVGATGASMLADPSLGSGYGGLGLLIGAYINAASAKKSHYFSLRS
ncbi:hypothetical protein [Falsiroseomonas sp. E2-1-a20]|uniref:hypothetical protein n=1 Tax=Falsiroseomonas sp. E2-1-a20 TaxID=3239300 RepID=UPI003F408868